MISAVLAPSGTIHGRWPGLNTSPKPFQQFLLCVQSSCFQTMVTWRWCSCDLGSWKFRFYRKGFPSYGTMTMTACSVQFCRGRQAGPYLWNMATTRELARARPRTDPVGPVHNCDRQNRAHPNFFPRNRKLLVITLTLLKLMAAAAMMGESSQPNTGYRRPAAMGMPKAL